MAVTYDEFVAAYPGFEFTNAEEFPRAAVEQALADAERWHSTVWGDSLSLGIRLRAAHMLATTLGKHSRQTTDVKGAPPSTSTYLAEWERLRKTIPAGPLVA